MADRSKRIKKDERAAKRARKEQDTKVALNSKNIFKEIIIILLLCLAIILVLGVLLYEYVPSNKIIPEPVAYTTPEDVKQEISKGEGVDDEQVIMTYSIDSTDLKNYERINTYVAGKPNPFSSYSETSQSGQNTTQSGSSQTGGNNTTSGGNTSAGTSNNNTNSTTSSGGSYIPDKGTK